MSRGKILKVVHIGKCGGSTACQAIKKSPLIKQKYKEVEIFHMRKPIYEENSDYLIIIRHPIERVISAYNWRYRLVIEEKRQFQKNQSMKELEISTLTQYKYLNQIAENLYLENGAPNKEVFKKFRSIRHVKQNISFYIKALLKSLNPEQIYGIIKQHNMDSDCKKLLGDINLSTQKKNKSENPNDPSLFLSLSSQKNLRRFFLDDFNCILSLRNLNAISDENCLKMIT